MGIISSSRKNIRINYTDLERTLIDCVQRTKYAGGWENIIYAINRIQKIDEEKIINYLKHFKLPSLNAKIGFLLEANKDRWNISRSGLVMLKQISLSNPINFFRKEPGKLNKEWNLYIPDNILSG